METPSSTRCEEADIEAILATGFSEFLTLPPQLISSLALDYQDVSRMLLGGGSIEAMQVYEVVVLWENQERTILAHEAEGSPLVGMDLLYGSDVHLEVVDGGQVTITPLP
jgi:predicted aspartyl protease